MVIIKMWCYDIYCNFHREKHRTVSDSAIWQNQNEKKSKTKPNDLNAKCTTRILMRPYHVSIFYRFLTFRLLTMPMCLCESHSATPRRCVFLSIFTLPIAFVRSASVKDTPSYLLLIFYTVESVYNLLWITNCVFDRRRYTLICFVFYSTEYLIRLKHANENNDFSSLPSSTTYTI